jgi:hypothetical protein
VREFPQLVQLHGNYSEHVACISLNLDYFGGSESPESLRKGVGEFLAKQGATFTNLICAEPNDAFYERLKLASVPAVLVYDRQGVLRKRFDNDRGEFGEEGFSMEQHILPLVRQLIAE